MRIVSNSIPGISELMTRAITSPNYYTLLEKLFSHNVLLREVQGRHAAG